MTQKDLFTTVEDLWKHGRRMYWIGFTFGALVGILITFFSLAYIGSLYI